MQERGNLIRLISEYDFMSSRLTLSANINSLHDEMEDLILSYENDPEQLKNLFSDVTDNFESLEDPLQPKFPKHGKNSFILALHIGIEHNDLRPLKLFMRYYPHGVNEILKISNKDTYDYTTPLMELCQCSPTTDSEKENLQRTFQCLTQLGNLDFHQRDSRSVVDRLRLERNALMYACYNAHDKIVKYILEHYPDMILERDSQGHSVLWYLLKKASFTSEKINILTMLLENPKFDAIKDDLYLDSRKYDGKTRHQLIHTILKAVERMPANAELQKIITQLKQDPHLDKAITDDPTIQKAERLVDIKVVNLSDYVGQASRINSSTWHPDEMSMNTAQQIMQCGIYLNKISSMLPQAITYPANSSTVESLLKYSAKVEKKILANLDLLKIDLDNYQKIFESLSQLTRKVKQSNQQVTIKKLTKKS